MIGFVLRANIDRYRRLLEGILPPQERALLTRLLAEDEQRLAELATHPGETAVVGQTPDP